MKIINTVFITMLGIYMAPVIVVLDHLRIFKYPHNTPVRQRSTIITVGCRARSQQVYIGFFVCVIAYSFLK